MEIVGPTTPLSQAIKSSLTTECGALTHNGLKLKGKSGQSAVEYVLVLAFSTLIFGLLFTAIRQSMYRVWICEMAPRVQAPAGCQGSLRSCYAGIGEAASPACPAN